MSNLTQFTTGGVKSIQFGVAYPGAGSTVGSIAQSYAFSVTISTINPAKSYVIIDWSGYTAISSSYYCYSPGLATITSNAFTYTGGWYQIVSNSDVYPNRVSWQVVEYY